MISIIENGILFLLFLWTNITQWIIYLNATMKRRRPLKALIIYSYIKGLVVNIILKSIVDNVFVDNDIIKFAYSSIVILAAVLTYIMLLYTFNEHFAKIAIIGTVVDVFASLIGYLSKFATNLMIGEVSFDFIPALYPTDFLLPIIAGIATYLILKLVKRFSEKLKNWDVKRKKITMTVFMAYMVCSFFSMYGTVNSVAIGIGLLSTVLFSYLLVSYVNYYHRTVIWENEMLKKQQLIAKMQYDGIVLQSEQIKHLQQEIDNKM